MAVDGAGGSAFQEIAVTVEPGPVNQPPEIAAPLPDVTVTLGSTVLVNISAAFTDPEGDPISGRVSSDRPDVASLSVSGLVISVTGASLGTATVTVSVTDGVDGPGRPVMQHFGVAVDEVPNDPPALVGELADVEVGVGRAVHVLAEFADPDGDRLAFTVASQRPDVASVRHAWSGGTLDIAVTGESPGTAVVSITATDGRAAAHASFNVMVEAVISPPTNLAWRLESATAGTLSWDPPRVGRDELTHYEVRYTGGSAGTSTAETPGVLYARLAGLGDRLSVLRGGPGRRPRRRPGSGRRPGRRGRGGRVVDPVLVRGPPGGRVRRQAAGHRRVPPRRADLPPGRRAGVQRRAPAAVGV